MSIDKEGRLREALSLGRWSRAEGFATHYYVSSQIGSDANTGLTPENPLFSIIAAFTAVTNGDVVHIGYGDYDEDGITLAASGVRVICEAGVYIQNTAPGVIVTVNGDRNVWEGGILSTAGQPGIQCLAPYCTFVDILLDDLAIGIDAGNWTTIINCHCINTSQYGFGVWSNYNIYLNCTVNGAPASRGFYLQDAGADHNFFGYCATLGCTAAGYETVAGADENLFYHCSQSSLCAGPIDAGANNTWVLHSEDSQILAGNTLQQDLKDIYDAAVAAEGVAPVTEATGTFSYDETNAGEQTAFTLVIAVRAEIGGIWLDFVNVTQDTTIRVKHQIDGANYRTFEVDEWEVATDDDGILITGFTAYRNVQVSFQCGGGGGGSVNVPYAVV